MEEKYYTVAQAANLLTLHPNTMRQLVNQRKIRVMKVGRRTIIPASCIEEFKHKCLEERHGNDY